MEFFLELLVNGLLVGMMYALVALSFVLIYKATSVINFAQGELVMFGGFIAAAMLTRYDLPLAIALPVALGLMISFGFMLERGMLRPLIGRLVIAIIMATVGLASVLRGLAPMIWGAATKDVPLPLPARPFILFDLFISPLNVVAAAASLVFLAGFGYFFKKTRTGIAMRAVADDQQAAMSMGIDVSSIFALTWGIAGLVSAIGGVIWGNFLGVDTHLALVGLKVFPVVILGGLDSVLGAILGGLIVGAVENVSAGFIDPYVGGGTKDFYGEAPAVVGAVLAGGGTGNLGGPAVDLCRVLGQAPLLQLQPAGLEGVRLEHLRAGLEHRLVHALNHVRAVQHEGLVALAREAAVVLGGQLELLERRAHAAVEDDDPAACCVDVVALGQEAIVPTLTRLCEGLPAKRPTGAPAATPRPRLRRGAAPRGAAPPARRAAPARADPSRSSPRAPAPACPAPAP